MVFNLARKAYEADGRQIINLTPNDNTPFEWQLAEWEK